MTLLRRIAPHLGAGLKTVALRSRASTEDNGDSAPGVLVLDQRGWVLHYTGAAERCLRDLGGLGPGWREGDGLPVAVGALRRALKPQTERDLGSVPRLCVTEDTVQKHLQNVFGKVGVRSRQALVKRLYLNTIFP